MRLEVGCFGGREMGLGLVFMLTRTYRVLYGKWTISPGRWFLWSWVQVGRMTIYVVCCLCWWFRSCRSWPVLFKIGWRSGVRIGCFGFVGVLFFFFLVEWLIDFFIIAHFSWQVSLRAAIFSWGGGIVTWYFFDV